MLSLLSFLADPLPKETPLTSFDVTNTAAGNPMQNFGYAVAAYGVMWFLLLLFLVFSRRKQGAMEARMTELEQALVKAQTLSNAAPIDQPFE